jgi:hypothetical protein
MAVIVNEFEVIPTPQEAPPPARGAEERPPSIPPPSFGEEVERTLRVRAERAARLEAS